MNTMFLTVFLVGGLAVVSPGPDFIMVTRNSLLYSKRVGITTAFGIVTGNMIWIAASILGISYVLSKAAAVFMILKWIGAAYLIYLGVGALRSKGCIEQQGVLSGAERTDISLRKAFWMGFLTNVFNPKCALFFVSFFSIVITPATPTIMQWAYGIEVMVIAIVWFSFVATVLSISKIRRFFERFSVWLDRVTGAILIALGIKVALSKV